MKQRAFPLHRDLNIMCCIMLNWRELRGGAAIYLEHVTQMRAALELMRLLGYSHKFLSRMPHAALNFPARIDIVP